MIRHATPEEMDQFCARALEWNRFVDLGQHLSDCKPCLELFRQTSRARRNHAPVVLDLSLERAFKDSHLSHENLVRLLDNRLDAESEEIVEFHLRTCAQCRGDVQSFREYRRQNDPELQVRFRPQEFPEPGGDWWRGWVAGWNWRSAAATALLVTLAILAAIFVLKNSSGRRGGNDKELTHTPKALVPNPATSPNSLSPNGPKRNEAIAPEQTLPAAERAFTLNDNGREIIVDKRGNIAGLPELSSTLQNEVREALIADNLRIPDRLKELDGVAGTVRGPGEATRSFRLLAPARAGIAEDRPSFRWEKVSGATGYQVFLSPAGYRDAISSERLAADVTEWRPSAPLKRGSVYTWMVTAFLDNGEEISAPLPTEGDKKFFVISEEKSRELKYLKSKVKSHFALGMFYLREGMLDEAEGEFKLLGQQNPNSPVIQKLLRGIQTWRR